MMERPASVEVYIPLEVCPNNNCSHIIKFSPIVRIEHEIKIDA